MKPPPWKTWVKPAALLFLGIAMYALAGLLLGPRGVESQLRAMVERQPGLTLELAAASVNPFTLSFSAANVIIIGPENTPLVSIARLEGRVHPASAIERAWILWRVTVHEPHSELHVGDDDFAAISRLIVAILRSTAENSGPGRDRIADLAVRRGELQLRHIRVAGTAAPPFVLHDLELEVRSGATSSRGSSFEFTAAASHRARLAASGEIRNDRELPGAELSFSIDDASVFNPYVSVGTGWEWSAGEAQGNALLEFREAGVRISGDVELRGFDIAESNGGDSVFDAATVVARGIIVDNSRPVPAIDTARFENARLRLEREPQGVLNTPPWLIAILDPASAQARNSRIELVNGRLDFTDRSLSPPLTFELVEIDGMLRRPSRNGDVATVSLRGQVADGGTGEVTAEWLPERPRDFARVDASLQDLSLAAISPYVLQAIGRPVPGGSLDLALHLSAEDEQLGLDNRLVIRNLDLGEAPLTLQTAQLPLDLAAALLEDDKRQITVNVHVPARRVSPGFDPTVLLTDALADFVTEISARPFAHLADLAGQPGIDLGRAAFPAGSPEVTEETAARLATLGTVLAQRPRLGLVVYPGYDPVADREALGRQQVELHVSLATSSGAPGQPREPIDFADPKVHSVLDEFAENRLPTSRQEAISSRHPAKGAAYYRDVFEVLVDSEDVSRTALNRLARYRAQAVVHSIVKSGDNGARTRQADVIKTVEPGDVSGVVALEVEPGIP